MKSLSRRLFVSAASKSAAVLGFATAAVASAPELAPKRELTMEEVINFLRGEFERRYPGAKIEPTWNGATPEELTRGHYACLIITARQA